GAIGLTVRHPLHVAKAAASVDALSGGRLVLGLASGDRPRELAAFGVDAERRGEVFAEHLGLVRRAWAESFPRWVSSSGTLSELDPLPKPARGAVPIMVTGFARQELPWIAQHADAWAIYPRPLALQAQVIARWRAVADGKPIAQS